MRIPPAIGQAPLLLAFLAAGCPTWIKPPGVPPVPVARDLNLEDIEKQLMAAQGRLISLKLDCVVSFQSSRIATREPCRGELLFRRDRDARKLRLRVKRIMAGTLMDVCTDGSQIWIYDSAAKVVYRGRDHAYYNPEGTTGVFPDDLAEIFDLWGTFQNRLRLFEKDVRFYRIQLITVDEAGVIRLHRRITIKRDDLAVVAYEILNPDNTIRARILMQNHKRHKGVLIPHRIIAQWPAAQTKLDMVVNYVDLAYATSPGAFVPSPRKRATETSLEGPGVEMGRPPARRRGMP